LAKRRTSDVVRREEVSQYEAFRILRSNLLVSLADLDRPSVIVTSALPGEGKTSTCVRLASALAQAGQRVVLVDVDLRRADVHRWVGGHNEVGVTDVLLGEATPQDALQYVPIDSGNGRSRALYLLAAGRRANSPTELLGGNRMSKLLDALAEQADVVLLDTPPVLPVADTLVIGRIATGAVLVVEARRTPIDALQQAKDALIRNQTRLLGVVVNKVDVRDTELGYGYGYDVDALPPPG
jgi:capsular exopolysaccharide synthesis family protein